MDRRKTDGRWTEGRRWDMTTASFEPLVQNHLEVHGIVKSSNKLKIASLTPDSTNMPATVNQEILISNSCILETSNTDELQRRDNDGNHLATVAAGSLYESLGVDQRDETAYPGYTLPDGYLEIEGSDCNVGKEEENAYAPERNVTTTKGHSTGEIKSLRTPYHDAKTVSNDEIERKGRVELGKTSSGLPLPDLKVEKRSEVDKERENIYLPKQNNRTTIQREKDNKEKLLCHYNDVEKLDLNSLRALIGKDKNFPLLLACTRKRTGCVYYHFVIVTKYSVDYVYIAHIGSLVRRKHRREFLNQRNLIGICNDRYRMSAEGKLPKRTSKFFNFKDGVYLIRDFDPKSDSEKDQISRRIAREVNVTKIHYSIRFYSCEHFAVHAMTGYIPKTTQLDNMGKKMRMLAYFTDNSIRTMVSTLKIGLQWQIMIRKWMALDYPQSDQRAVRN